MVHGYFFMPAGLAGHAVLAHAAAVLIGRHTRMYLHQSGTTAEAVTSLREKRREKRAKCVSCVRLYGVLLPQCVSGMPARGRFGNEVRTGGWPRREAQIGANRVQVLLCTRGDIKAPVLWVVQAQCRPTLDFRKSKRLGSQKTLKQGTRGWPLGVPATTAGTALDRRAALGCHPL